MNVQTQWTHSGSWEQWRTFQTTDRQIDRQIFEGNDIVHFNYDLHSDIVKPKCIENFNRNIDVVYSKK